MIVPVVLLWLADADTIHARHRVEQPAAHDMLQRELDAPDEVGAFTAWVYGYHASWAGTLDDLPWDRLTHVAIFDVGVQADGTIVGTAYWDEVATQAVEMGAGYGVKIHLAVTSFDATTMGAMLGNAGARSAAAASLAALVDAHGAHGVSVDFEGMNAANSADLVAFVEEVGSLVEEVTVATPAVDWNGAYDYDLLSAGSDGLFIMAYDYHWRGGDPGPVGPLNGGAPWGQYAMDWSVEDHLTWGATADKLILGLPLYGYSWPSTGTGVPGTATADASSVVFANAVVEAEQFGRQWDAVSSTPYYFPSGTQQTWYDDTESLDAKIGFAMDSGLRGIGFWALTYEGGDAAFWDMVAGHTQVDDPDPSGTTGGESDTGDGEEGGSTSTDDSAGDTATPPLDDSGSGNGDDTGGANEAGDGSAAVPPSRGDADEGCGCRSGGAPPWVVLMMMLLVRRARPRRPF